MAEIHTHRGHCQLCTRVQAIDPVTGLIAKHGYDVQLGYYRGTCPGSGLLTLHVERKHADTAIERALDNAARIKRALTEYEEGRAFPMLAHDGTYFFDEKKRQQPRMVAYAKAPPIYQADALRGVIRDCKTDIRQHEMYAADLSEWADRVYNKVPAYEVRDLEPRDWEVNDEIRIGGKGRNGFTAIIEAIEKRPMRTNGVYRGTVTVSVKHARITRPARAERRSKPDRTFPEGYVIDEARPAMTFWHPIRNIKRPPPPLVAALKKAGKL